MVALKVSLRQYFTKYYKLSQARPFRGNELLSVFAGCCWQPQAACVFWKGQVHHRQPLSDGKQAQTLGILPDCAI